MLNRVPPGVRHSRKPRFIRPYLRDLYNRRLAQGPEIYRPRSDWLCWNRDSELTAFLSRIGEKIDKDLIEIIMTDRSYTSFWSVEKSKPIDNAIQNNTELADIGFSVTENFLSAFLRSVYPQFPEEWITTIVQFLKSTSELAFVAGHLGIKDIVLYSDQVDYSSSKIVSAPPNPDILANVLMALVGALAKDKVERAHLFIRDFIVARLADLDLTELVSIPEPLPLLQGILRSEGRGPPETRLLYQSSMNTVLACFQVGIYSDRQLVGEAPGETLLIAEQEALRQSIRNFFRLTDNRPPIPIHGILESLDLERFSEPNVSLNYYLELAVDYA
ncbi:hypothetical protein MN116_004789 [Schistosoma mekongi]|uniref:Large ribosomal subunit protein mL44 n=1 Tax=Schistosoma mekongi TaxID=38744 RepID=A0AAE2D4W8_SCHME|nr:hypothetical protein MN116_004789 [Schistosoma mekongi]